MDFNSNRNGFIAQINVTPFVDVMLVLLVIFMITAPFMTSGVEVDLPQTKTVETLPQESNRMVLTIKKNGRILLDKYELKQKELSRYLQKLNREREQMLYLRADKEVPYGLVVKVMSDVKEAGIQRLGVVAESEKE